MRSFIGIKLNDCIEDIKNIINHLKQEDKLANYTRIENIHLTLEFLGEIELKDIKKIKEVFQEINANEFNLKINKITNLKDMIILKVKENKELTKLQNTIHDKLESLGFKLEKRKFLPHITIARRTSLRIDQNISLTSKINSIILFESIRLEGILTYIPKLEMKLINED